MQRFLVAVLILVGVPALGQEQKPAPLPPLVVNATAQPAATPAKVIDIPVAIPSGVSTLKMRVKNRNGPVPVGNYRGGGGTADTSSPYYGGGSSSPIRR